MTTTAPACAQPAPNTDLLRLDDLSVRIPLRVGEISPLNHLGLTIGYGETVGVVGESGCGKTMTALSIMGLLPGEGRVSEGSIHFEGRDLTAVGAEEVRRVRGTRIGMIFQDPLTSLNPTMRIGDQVAEPLIVHEQTAKAEARERAIDILLRVGMPRPQTVIDEYPHQLSGGMRQRVMIAMALICGPRLLIADEPTTALDVTTQRQILDLIDDLKDEFKSSVMLVTHDLGVVAGRTDRVAVMYAGRVVECAPTEQVYQDPQNQYTRALMAALPEQAGSQNTRLYSIPGMPPDLRHAMEGCPFAPRCPLADEQCRAERPPVTLSGTDSGHLVACHHAGGPQLDRGQVAARPRATELAQRPVVVAVEGVDREFAAMGGRVIRRRTGIISAVSGVSFEVHEGETFGLVGESGCGKSTLGRLIAGLDMPTGGRIMVEGNDVIGLTGGARKRMHRQVQMMFQDSYAAMDPRMRIDEILAEPLVIQGVGDRRSREAQAEEILDRVGLAEAVLERYPHEFSGGQLQRIGLARALVLGPKLVVCDEPVSALDVSVQAQVLNLMRDIQADLGLAYVFISHDLSVVRYMSDRIGVMYLGKLVELGPAQQVADRPRHPYTQALIDAVPVADPARPRKDRVPISGELPSALNPPPGCRFSSRCPLATDQCATEPPLAGDDHQVACHHPLYEG